MPNTFIPSRDGLHIANNFPNVVLPNNLADAFLEAVIGGAIGLILGPFGDIGALIGAITGGTQSISAGAGRCGGIAWLTLDYWYANVPTPTCIDGSATSGSLYASSENKSGHLDDFINVPHDIPPDNTPLSTAVYNRLMDSLQTSSMWAQTGAWCFNESNQDVANKTDHNEFPRVVNSLNMGMPVVLSLITRSNLSGLHQVVATGYGTDTSGNKTVSIYDVNFPDADGIILVQQSDGSWNEIDNIPGPNNQSTAIAANHPLPWKGWFVEEYSPKAPPFIDMQMASAIAVTASPKIGHPFTISFNISNTGPYPAHVASLQIVVNDQFSSAVLAQSPGPGAPEAYDAISPGQTFTISYNTNSLSTNSGRVNLQIQYQTAEGWWVNVSPTPAFPSNLTLNIEQAAYLDGVYVNSIQTKVNMLGQPVAIVQCYAVPMNFDGPTQVNWTVDAHDTGVTASDATLTIPLGQGPALDLVHTITATAVSSGPVFDTASQSITITIPSISGTLTVDLADSVQTQYSKTTTRVFGPLVLSDTQVAFTKLAIRAVILNAIGNFQCIWNPTPDVPLESGGTIAIYAIKLNGSANNIASYDQSFQVSLSIQDQAGQKLTLQGTYSGVQEFNSSGVKKELPINYPFIPQALAGGPVISNTGDPITFTTQPNVIRTGNSVIDTRAVNSKIPSKATLIQAIVRPVGGKMTLKLVSN